MEKWEDLMSLFFTGLDERDKLNNTDPFSKYDTLFQLFQQNLETHSWDTLLQIKLQSPKLCRAVVV